MTPNLTGQPAYQSPNLTTLGEKNSNLERSSSKCIEGLIIINNLYQIIGWNPASSYFTGYTREKMIGSSILDLLSSAEAKKAFTNDFNRLINHCEKSDFYYESTISILMHSGDTRNVTFQWNRMILAGVRLFNICVKNICNDENMLNNLQKKEQELARQKKELAKMASSNEQLEAFAYVASHDLKEPLRSIGNFTQLLEQRLEGKLDKTDQEFFDFVTSGVKNMNSLIEDLLTYSRVNSGKHEVSEIKPINALSVVINSLNQRIIETDAQIAIRELPAEILGNPTKIKQLFQNLIANAIKFQNPEVNPVITVSGREERDRWVFVVSDNGIGIKEEYYQKVFSIFTKLHHKSVYPGSGIGLSVCQRIVEQHDGDIWVDSVFGSGTSFHFSISKNQCIG